MGDGFANSGQELHRTVFEGDNLDVLRGIDSESVDLVYLDPPFNSNKTHEAPVGSKAAGAAFKDAWTLSDVDLIEHNRLKREHEWLYALIHAAKNTHSKGMFSYLMMMSPRLFELRRVLKPTGSIYLHCDPTASHYLKLVMDGIFGRSNFQNEIVWCYKSGGASKRRFAKKHDILLFYAKDARKCRFNPLKIKSYGQTGGGQGGAVKYYRDDKGTYSVVTARDWWEISMLSTTHGERIGYPTQKPVALLDRIIKASSNEGDMVLDPFCGCATTLVSAELLQRRWCGIDLSPKTAELVVQRISEKEDMVSFAGFRHATDVPIRTDIEREKASTPKQRRELKNKLHNVQEGRCNLCHDEFTGIQHFEMDHIVPVAKGGRDWVDNFQLLCSNCNRIKGKGTQEAARAKVAKNKHDSEPPMTDHRRPKDKEARGGGEPICKVRGSASA